MGAAVIAMEAVALLVGVLSFGWPVLLVGAPLLVGTVGVLVVVRIWEVARRRLERRRAARWDAAAAVPGGLMSGFFEVAAVPDQPPMPPVDLGRLRELRIVRHAAGWYRDQRWPGPIGDPVRRGPARRLPVRSGRSPHPGRPPLR